MTNSKNRIFRIFLRHSLPLLIVTLLFGTGATIMVRSFIQRNSISQAHRTLNQISAYYDVILDEMDSLSLMLSTNPEMLVRLQNILENEASIDLDTFREIKLIRSFLSAPANARPYIEGIYVYLENHRQLVLSGNLGFVTLPTMEDASWYRTYRAMPTDIQEYSEHVTIREGTATEQSIIRIYRRITTFAGAPLGIIVLDIKESALAQSYMVGEGERFSVYNNNENLLFSNPPGASAYPKDDLELFQAKSGKYGWTYVLSIYKPQLYALSITLRNYTLALTIFALLIGLFLTHRTNRREHQFLANVMKQLTQVGDIDLKGKTPSEYRNIFDYLNYHVIKTFIEQDYLRWQKEAMEYRALQMQINPHFLFNALDTINWKAVRLAEGENDVSRMILLLSKLIKYSLQVDGLDGVPLEKELEQTDCYIQLQQIRFRDSFTFTCDVDSTLRDVLVPSMFFQPILENSFNHGFVEGRMLVISLRAESLGENVLFTISNNGNPLSTQELERLNKDNYDALKKRTSLGLQNIRNRLELFSQRKGRMVISSDGRQGMSVSILLQQRRSVFHAGGGDSFDEVLLGGEEQNHRRQDGEQAHRHDLVPVELGGNVHCHSQT